MRWGKLCADRPDVESGRCNNGAFHIRNPQDIFIPPHTNLQNGRPIEERPEARLGQGARRAGGAVSIRFVNTCID